MLLPRKAIASRQQGEDTYCGDPTLSTTDASTNPLSQNHMPALKAPLGEYWPMAHPGRSRGGNRKEQPRQRPQGRRGKPDSASRKPDGTSRNIWLYGRHAVLGALANPRRQVTKVLATAAFIERFGKELSGGTPPEVVDRDMLDGLVGSEAVHQGIAAYARPLPPLAVDDLIASAAEATTAVILVLDEITDPRNVGAILRSAAAFGATGVVITRHNAANETGALAKAASGALDQVSIAEAPNLRRTIEQLKEAGFWCLGLDHPAQQRLGQEAPPARTAWILGAEGKGLRALTARSCDGLVEIPIAPDMESLNVSNAAAIALYEWSRNHQAG